MTRAGCSRSARTGSGSRRCARALAGSAAGALEQELAREQRSVQLSLRQRALAHAESDGYSLSGGEHRGVHGGLSRGHLHAGRTLRSRSQHFRAGGERCRDRGLLRLAQADWTLAARPGSSRCSAPPSRRSCTQDCGCRVPGLPRGAVAPRRRRPGRPDPGNGRCQTRDRRAPASASAGSRSAISATRKWRSSSPASCRSSHRVDERRSSRSSGSASSSAR